MQVTFWAQLCFLPLNVYALIWFSVFFYQESSGCRTCLTWSGATRLCATSSLITSTSRVPCQSNSRASTRATRRWRCILWMGTMCGSVDSLFAERSLFSYCCSSWPWGSFLRSLTSSSYKGFGQRVWGFLMRVAGLHRNVWYAIMIFIYVYIHM